MSVPDSWAKPLDLGDYLNGRIPQAKPAILTRSDGCRLVYAGKVNETHGEPEAGKGFIVGQAVGELVMLERHVVYLDFDQDPAGVVQRVLASGASPERIEQYLHLYPIAEPLAMVRPQGMRGWPDESADTMDRLMVPEPLALVVIDGVNAAMAMFGLDPGNTPDTADFMRLLAFPFRDGETAVWLVDHVVKDRTSRGRWSFGAVHKSAALDGASFEVQVKAWPAPGKVGRLRLRVSKDRHGAVRAVSRRIGEDDFAADVVIDGTGEAVRVRIDPPADPADFKPTWYMQKVSEFLETCLEPTSVRQVLAGVGGKNAHVQRALRELVADGFAETVPGPRSAILHRSVHPYRQEEP